ncbi:MULTISPECIES: BMP family lipoprotein [Saccharibacillus]|uniref:BMP family ABC transporter substrate-binding protein n=1 Tax=Saccharibacillus brassicae TaxID=2583377 RepID=A0A4Y6V2J7_SACBS|nr:MULTISPECIES: BMP family protein [Saccharibacillus]MWJ31047.1 BMP family ABC transporter substrate-binding protein [Saccharibacillus sp. WB 17]QDH22465.1 BMP family ABC transporter substrate-binding protein [Saccharibacillus brassicae]
MKKAVKFSIFMLLAFSLVLAACGNNNSGGGTAATGSEGEAGTAAKSDIKIAMVTDTGGVNDKSFNQTSWEALQALEKEQGITVKYLQSKSEADYQPNLNQFVKDGYNLTWGIGFALESALKDIAGQNPDSNFAIIDAAVDAPNVESVLFSENEGAFLVGVVAGKMTKTNKIGFVGGMDSPTIKKFEVGFKAGIEASNPEAQFTSVYASGFDKPDEGKSAAATLYNDGADIVFQAAGGTGTGVFNEALDRKNQGQEVWVIGVDKDQSIEFGTEVTLTSMIKRVDVAMKTVSQQVIDGTFKGGTITTLGLKDDGVGIADTSSVNVPQEVLDEVQSYKEKIVNGEIKVPAE